MRKRLDALDAARGIALVAMAGYHLTWDLAYFGVVDATTPFTPPMRLASHAIGASFLALAGFSLALAHGEGFRARAFWLRLAKIGAAVALVTGASYALAPEAFIGFGILHCIAAASLLAAAFLVRPGAGAGYAALASGAAMAATPFVWTSPALNAPAWVWLGLGTTPPQTLDWRPLLPWGGALLMGLGVGLLKPPSPVWEARAPAVSALGWAGRHSLAIYLIHQPVLIGLLWGALHVTGVSGGLAARSYERACKPACVQAGGDGDACTRACACVVREAAKAGLAEALMARGIEASQRRRLEEIVQACGTEAGR